MPISAYFRGHGEEVLRAMRRRYGRKKGARVFYATANRRDETPEDDLREAIRRMRGR